MSNDMKVIMENWDRFVLQELNLPPCNASPVDIDTFLRAVKVAISSPEVQKKKIEQLKSQEKTIENANKIIEIAGLLGGAIDVAGLGVTLGAGSATAALGGAVISLFANVINAKQQKKTNDSLKKLLKLLCIDEALLDTVDNQIEKEYWSNSDLRDRVKQYINAALATATPDPMPDFTRHFVAWLNNDPNSPYSKTGTRGLDTDIVMRSS